MRLANWVGGVGLLTLAGCGSQGGGGRDLAGADFQLADLGGSDFARGPDLAMPPDPNACNTVVEGSPGVTPLQVARSAPPPTGGPLFDGRYYLTDATSYTGPNGPAGPTGSDKVFHTIVIAGGTYQSAFTYQMMTTRGNGSIAAMGNVLTTTPSCPAPSPATSSPYTAGGSRLHIYLPTNNTTLEYVYTRQ